MLERLLEQFQVTAILAFFARMLLTADGLLGYSDCHTQVFKEGSYMSRSLPLSRRSTAKLLLAGAAVAVTAGSILPAQADGSVNVYTYREPGLVKPLFDQFTSQTGIDVNVIFAKDGLEQRIKAEGENSPADVLFTVDIARLQDAVDIGVTQPVASPVLDSTVPAEFRDPAGHWHGVSMRARVVYASRERVDADQLTYESLADPEWRGRICIRSGHHIYNNALFAAHLAHHGEEETKSWLEGLKANLAKKPSGGDRDVAKDIAAGVCDLGIGNTYYVGLMENGDPEQQAWAEGMKVIMPTFEDGGTHINISGIAMAKNAPNRENAVALMEWLVGDEAQQLYASMNYEYPVKPDVEVDPTVAAWGDLKPDTLPLSDIAANKQKAAEIVDRVTFDEGPGV
jgi:iron(III) transport system substrate-binding protein